MQRNFNLTIPFLPRGLSHLLFMFYGLLYHTPKGKLISWVIYKSLCMKSDKVKILQYKILTKCFADITIRVKELYQVYHGF